MSLMSLNGFNMLKYVEQFKCQNKRENSVAEEHIVVNAESVFTPN